ncbi:hypothetical protein [Pseudobutyrivibrio sp.]|nr:hypothetical protein [Pseudobutyrivibrio sp.]MBP3263639.1 hypothetical protein [Pseudobutyrivibrio sp.]
MSGYEVSISFDDIEDKEKRDQAKRLVVYQSLLTKDTDEEKRAAANK